MDTIGRTVSPDEAEEVASGQQYSEDAEDLGSDYIRYESVYKGSSVPGGLPSAVVADTDGSSGNAVEAWQAASGDRDNEDSDDEDISQVVRYTRTASMAASSAAAAAAAAAVRAEALSLRISSSISGKSLDVGLSVTAPVPERGTENLYSDALGDAAAETCAAPAGATLQIADSGIATTCLPSDRNTYDSNAMGAIAVATGVPMGQTAEAAASVNGLAEAVPAPERAAEECGTGTPPYIETPEAFADSSSPVPSEGSRTAKMEARQAGAELQPSADETLEQHHKSEPQPLHAAAVQPGLRGSESGDDTEQRFAADRPATSIWPEPAHSSASIFPEAPIPACSLVHSDEDEVIGAVAPQPGSAAEGWLSSAAGLDEQFTGVSQPFTDVPLQQALESPGGGANTDARGVEDYASPPPRYAAGMEAQGDEFASPPYVAPVPWRSLDEESATPDVVATQAWDPNTEPYTSDAASSIPFSVEADDKAQAALDEPEQQQQQQHYISPPGAWPGPEASDEAQNQEFPYIPPSSQPAAEPAYAPSAAEDYLPSPSYLTLPHGADSSQAEASAAYAERTDPAGSSPLGAWPGPEASDEAQNQEFPYTPPSIQPPVEPAYVPSAAEGYLPSSSYLALPHGGESSQAGEKVSYTEHNDLCEPSGGAAALHLEADLPESSGDASTLPLEDYRIAAAAGLVSPQLASLLGLAPLPAASGEAEGMVEDLDAVAEEEEPEDEYQDAEEAQGEEQEAGAEAWAAGALYGFSEAVVATSADMGDAAVDLIAGGPAVAADTEQAVAAAAGVVAELPGFARASGTGPAGAEAAVHAALARGPRQERDPFDAADTDDEGGVEDVPLADNLPYLVAAAQEQQWQLSRRTTDEGPAPSEAAESALPEPQVLSAPVNALAPPAPADVQPPAGDKHKDGPATRVAIAAVAGAGTALLAGAAMVAGAAAATVSAGAPQGPLRTQASPLPPQELRQPLPPQPTVSGLSPGMAQLAAAADAFLVGGPGGARPRGMPMQGPPSQPQQTYGGPPQPAPMGRGGPMPPPTATPLPTSISPNSPPMPAPGGGPAPRPAMGPPGAAGGPLPGPVTRPPGAPPGAMAPPAMVPRGAPPAGMTVPMPQGALGPLGPQLVGPMGQPSSAPPGAPFGAPMQLPRQPNGMPPGVRPPGAAGAPHPGAPHMGPAPGPMSAPGPRPMGPAPGQGAGPRPPMPPGGGPMVRPGGPAGPPMPHRPPLGAPPGLMPPPGLLPGRPPAPPGPPRPGLPGPPPPPSPYPGLLYTEGRDTLGRPVAVLNTAMLPAKANKGEVLEHLLQQLQPMVQREYVLVVLSLALGVKASSVPTRWALGAYGALAKPYRKNVKHIVLVQPSAWARALLALAQPFVSKKAAHKVKKVDNLTQIADATGGEVKLESLGARFIREIQYGVGAPPLAGLGPPGAPMGGIHGPPRPMGPPGPRPPFPGPPGMRPPMGQQQPPYAQQRPGQGPPPGPGPVPGAQFYQPPRPIMGPLGPQQQQQPVPVLHAPGAQPGAAGSAASTPVYGPGGLAPSGAGGQQRQVPGQVPYAGGPYGPAGVPLPRPAGAPPRPQPGSPVTPPAGRAAAGVGR